MLARGGMAAARGAPGRLVANGSAALRQLGRWQCSRHASSASGAAAKHALRRVVVSPVRASSSAAQAGLAAGAAGVVSALAAVAVRCDDNDDDDAPLTPEQQRRQDKLDALAQAAEKYTMTPMMSVSMAMGMAWPLAISIRQGSPGLTIAGMVLSVPIIYSVVGFATHAKRKEIDDITLRAERGDFPSLLVG